MSCGLKLSVIVLLSIQSTFALYEDQTNKYDWKKEYIGKVREVVYESSLSVSKNLYVTTERNSVASLSSKNGQINWRQISDEKIAKLLQSSDGILTVSSNGIVRLWDQGNGLIKWDVNLMSEVKDDSRSFEFVDIAIMDLPYTEDNVIAILSSVGIFTIRSGSSSSSRTKMKVKYLEITTQGESRLFVDSESKSIILLNLNEGLSVSVTFYDPNGLTVENSYMIQAAWMDNTKHTALLENNRFLYASKEMDAIYIIDLQKGTEISNEPLSTLNLNSAIVSIHSSKDKDVIDMGEDFYVVTKNGEVVHLRMNEKNDITVISRANQSSKNSKVLQLDVMKISNERYVFIATQEGRTLEVNGYSQTSGKEDTSLALNYELPEDVGEIEGVFINMFLKRTTPVGYRILLTTSDDCALMVMLPTRLAWRRDEALANIVMAEMLDLPLSDIEARIEVEFEQSEKLSIVEMFINRVKAQFGQVQSFARHLNKGIKEGTLFEKRTEDPLIQDESLTRDPFSLHKMLVLATKCGKIFGMDSLSGEIIWRLYAADMADKNLRLLIQRTTAHFPHPPSALLLGAEKDSSSTTTLNFNPITGETTRNGNPKKIADIIQVMLVPVVDSAYLRPLLLLDKELNVHLVPDTQDIKDRLEAVRSSVYLLNADKKSGTITGYWLQKDLKMIQTFVIKIPAEQEVVLVRGKEPFERIDAMGRPLADRSVLYKYLNPNLVLVVTASKDGPEQSSSVTMYLIDGVSGHIVYYATHKKASGPIHAVHSENWIIYSYWNAKARRTEIASYELYEGKQLRNETSFSSFDDLPGVPVVFSQGYIFGGSVTAMGVSKTERGLTSRQILFGLGRGAVFGMPRRFFDPRRPLIPETSDREEGLIPYAPEIVIHPSLIINYNKTIQGITNIYSCPSALESTNIVLVTGLDIFFTRTQPSKMFDVLKEDFEYLLIVAVLSGMSITAIVTRNMAQNKKLKKAWK